MAGTAVSSPPAGGDVPTLSVTEVWVAPAEFQSTPPRGWRHVVHRAMMPRRSFNPRPRAGGDTSRAPSSSRWAGFNPRPRAGGDVLIRCLLQTARSRFNPRPRAGGDLNTSASTFVTAPSFNPRPRAGGDLTCATWCWPTRTCFNPRPRAGGDSSTARGSTRCSSMFQSTPPRGGRLVHREGLDAVLEHVSIHAPARGATRPPRGARRGARACFNPRPRAGGDSTVSSAESAAFSAFQSTPPRGGRRGR